MAAADAIPIVNLLSDQAHPMQALADLLTIEEEIGLAQVKRVAYVGDANNVWRSLALGCAMLGIDTSVASPTGNGPTPLDIDRIRSLGGALLVKSPGKKKWANRGVPRAVAVFPMAKIMAVAAASYRNLLCVNNVAHSS